MQMTVDLKEAREINKLHQELNGKLREKLDLEKKEHAITREDVQAKDLELGKMMEKMTRKDSWEATGLRFQGHYDLHLTVKLVYCR